MRRVLLALFASGLAAVLLPASARAAELRLKITPRHLSFDQVLAGTVSAPKTVTLLNPNSSPISIESIPPSGSFAVSANDCGSSLAAGASCEVSVTFHTAGGKTRKGTAASGKLSIVDDAAGSPQIVALSGTTFGATGIFATNFALVPSQHPTMTAYSATAKGDVHPAATIKGGFALGNGFAPSSVALDSSGNIYLADDADDAILIYPPGSNGKATPAGAIGLGEFDSPIGVALDSNGKIYVADSAGTLDDGIDSILVYSADSNGDTAPIAIIGGDNTGLEDPSGVAVDSSGNIYVANFGDPTTDTGQSITVYSPGSNGDVAPIATLAGKRTGLTGPSALAIGPLAPPR